MTTASGKHRVLLFTLIFAIHGALILGPLGYYSLRDRSAKKKEIAFRVKLGGFEPSHAPEVGPPERIRPAPQPPKPAVQPKPKPKPPKPAVKPKPKPPKPAVQPKPKPKPPKPAVKPKPKPKPVKPAVKPKPAVKSRPKPKPPVKPAEVFHDDSWDKFDPNRPTPPASGSNFNRNVPIGSRDRGQKLGKPDHRTPAGGATADEEKYWAEMIPFLRERWIRPPGVLVDAATAVTVHISADRTGRVVRARITRPSPNPVVNASVEAMLKKLVRIPAPPAGPVDFEIKLVSE